MPASFCRVSLRAGRFPSHAQSRRVIRGALLALLAGLRAVSRDWTLRECVLDPLNIFFEDSATRTS